MQVKRGSNNTSRRYVLKGLASLPPLLMFADVAKTQAELLQRPLLTSSYQSTIDASENEPLTFGLSRPKGLKPWASLSPRPTADWVWDGNSVDYNNVAAGADLNTFKLTAKRFAELLASNAFATSGYDTVLFGLRGCSIANFDDKSDFVESLILRETPPDHINARCVLGVFRLNPPGLWATTASTLPGIDRVYEYSQGGRPANLLPTGYHAYTVGLHGRSHPRAWQPGAFLQVEPVCVLRAKDNMSYAVPSAGWDFTARVTYDNIHAAIRDTGAAGAPYFSSAGCQTIPGDYDSINRTHPLGSWALFRERAGLSRVPVFTDAQLTTTADDGKRFVYALFTGRDARLASTSGVLSLSRLRYGSSGEAVAKLRKRLDLRPSGIFDQELMQKVIKWQLERGKFADGIVGEELMELDR